MNLVIFNLILMTLLISCVNKEDQNDKVIASEDELFDVFISEASPDIPQYNSKSAQIGIVDGSESRLLIQIPQFLDLYQEDIIASSVAEILLELSVDSVPVNPENIRLKFLGGQWSPYATWNSAFYLKQGFEWQTPGGDFLDLDYQIPHIEKDGLQKRLKFDITSQVIKSIEDEVSIYGFALTVIESEFNAEQELTVITFNNDSGTPPRATLSFSNSDIIF